MSIRITSGESVSLRATASTSVLGLADDLEILASLEDQAEAAADKRLVVDDQDT